MMRFPLFLFVAALLAFATSARATETETVDLQGKIQALLDQVEKFERRPDGEVMRELLSYGAAIVKPVERRLKSAERPLTQKYYLILLYGVGDQSLTKTIVPLTQSDDSHVRLWALYNLAKYGDAQGIAALIRALGDSGIPVDAKELAADRLRELTGENIEYRASMDAQQRERAYQHWQEWAKSRHDVNVVPRAKK